VNLQGAPTFSPDDYPDVPEQLLSRLTQTFDELYSALSGTPDRSLLSGSFTSEASGVSTLSLKNPLPAKPQHVTVAIRKDDLSDFAAAWSWWHQTKGDQIQLSFIGLPASTKLVYSVEVL
jgi:hypothetical protein